MNGKVYLLGTGPGDPDLLTLKALRALRAADVVLHEDLVTPAILKFVPPSAQVQNVRKRCARKSITQEEIHARMVAFANDGLTVVRLKGGDPLIFGHAGEEMESLRAAGTAFEVIPGLTAVSAAAAPARIPLTDRRPAATAMIWMSPMRLPPNKEWRERRMAGHGQVLSRISMEPTDISKRKRRDSDG